MTPHVAGCAEAVQHDDRWTMSADAYVDLGAVGFDLTRLHTGREGVDAVLMSDVVHRFTPRFKGTGPLSRGGRVAPSHPLISLAGALDRSPDWRYSTRYTSYETPPGRRAPTAMKMPSLSLASSGAEVSMLTVVRNVYSAGSTSSP